MRVEAIMSTPVTFTQQSVKLAHLKDMLTRKKINAVPVLEEDGTIAGIISTQDLVAVHSDELLVRDILTRKVHICLKNNRVKDAAKIMVKHDVHHIVVMEDGKVIGIVSSMDIVKVYSQE